jgi:hypothetical protein
MLPIHLAAGTGVEDAGDVEDPGAAVGGAGEGFDVVEGDAHERDRQTVEAEVRLADDTHHVVAAGEQVPNDVGAHESGAAGEEVLHRARW